MAEGFKVADAYVAIHTDDDTKRGRDKIDRDTKKWGDSLGNDLGKRILRGIMRGLLGLVRGLAALTALVAKFSLLGLAVGVAGAAIAGLLGGIVQLMPVISALVQTLVAASGVLLLYPAIIATVLGAVLTLKLGLQGVGAALKAGLTGDMEAFNAALQKLAPNAQAFVKEIVALKPAFERLRSTIQNSLFADFAEILRKIAEVYLPILTGGLDKMAQALNSIAKGIAGFLLDAGTQADIGTILGNAASAAKSLGAALIPILQILRDVLVVSTGVFASLSGKLLPIFQAWADTINQMREDGTLEKLITDGLGALKQLAGLLVDIVGIVKGLFGAAGENNGIFAFFDRLNKLVNSASGQAAITAFFDALTAAAVALTPALVALLTALVPIFNGLSLIAVAFGPLLTPLVVALGDALVALVPAFLALGPIMVPLADGLMPLAQILTDLVVEIAPYAALFFTLLADLLKQLAPVAAPVGKALGLLVVVFSELIALFGPLIAGGLKLLAEVLIAILEPLDPLIREMMPLFAELFERIFQALEPMIPVLAEFAITLVQLFIQYLPQLIPLFEIWAALAIKIAEIFAGEFIQVLQDLMPHLPELFQQLMDLAVAVTQLAIVLTPLIIMFVKILGSSGQLQISIPLLIAWITIFTESIKFVTGAIQGWINFMVWLGGIFTWARGIIRDWIDWVVGNWRRLGDLIGYVVNYIGDAIGNLVNGMWNAGRNLIGNLVNGIWNAIPGLKNAASYAASLFRSFWPFSPAKQGPLSGRGDLRLAGQNMIGRLVSGLNSQTGSLAAAANNLAGLLQFGGTPGLATAGAGSSGTGGSSSGTPVNYFMVQVGDQPIREIAVAEITNNPGVVAAAATEGDRANAALMPRKRIGDI